ncbi:hypothetical protein BV20DRAFT_846276 [Pilatotrama ljubarskyi]|nr:hypothetical protein BV20DRAFT_846276 [Pilatotrama ljubarskyi]
MSNRTDLSHHCQLYRSTARPATRSHRHSFVLHVLHPAPGRAVVPFPSLPPEPLYAQRPSPYSPAWADTRKSPPPRDVIWRRTSISGLSERRYTLARWITREDVGWYTVGPALAKKMSADRAHIEEEEDGHVAVEEPLPRIPYPIFRARQYERSLLTSSA